MIHIHMLIDTYLLSETDLNATCMTIIIHCLHSTVNSTELTECKEFYFDKSIFQSTITEDVSDAWDGN